MLEILVKCAEQGRLVCDCIEVRKLWYAGLVQWCSSTEVCLTSSGLNLLYRAEEKGEIVQLDDL